MSQKKTSAGKRPEYVQDFIPVKEIKHGNLIIVHCDVHKLIHASKSETIAYYLDILNMNDKMLKKVNKLRKSAELPEII